MTLQDLMELLLDEAHSSVPNDVAIARAVLLAYEMGLEQGRKEAHALD
jgi:hypothetical protein